MSLGFQNAGFNIACAFDNWLPAVKVYELNFHHPIRQMDLGDLKDDFSLLNQYKPQLIIGGPPCQDFSHAGKRDETLGRADLSISYAEIVKRLQPDYFVMENVDRAAKSQTFEKVRQIFKSAGYGLSERVLDASLCGAPQSRKRVFLVGELNGNDDFLLPYLEKNLSKQPLTVNDYFTKIIGRKLTTEYYYRHPRNYSRRAIYGVHEPSATIRGVNRPIPANYPGHPGDATPISEKVRPLTTKERSLIQTFPENFVFVGTKSNIEQMVGNAVPVKLAEFVAHALSSYIQDKEQGLVENPLFQARLLQAKTGYITSDNR